MKKLALLLLIAFAAGTVALATPPAPLAKGAPQTPKGKIMSVKKLGKKKMGKKMGKKTGKKPPVAAPAK